ncbi:carbamoyltransferase HypF [Roseiconus nitratireducens]|uniref:Carbamoyltransferase n=1 Tax=Roseiconus nitratireducens TaxID=2605748 RepID=A0A5M6DBL4_9BACT|nr:carbamoyltransferase HypF [Roseiconus nitratireducens]KAA5543712.1 carbamoyltransferase HypF [Roseiconus nitratireducens]
MTRDAPEPSRQTQTPNVRAESGPSGARQRLAITVTGVVQGVGFRPFIHTLALRFGLSGSVKNHSGEVRIQVQGEPTMLTGFLDGLRSQAPGLSSIDRLDWTEIPVRPETGFAILPSDEEGTAGQIFVSPDLATCPACRRELFDPSDRRYRYAFLNCTDCGPRLTIIRRAPYDRGNTTMAGFEMCDCCRAEYSDPANRRFHAQPVACPECGPQLTLLDDQGVALDSSDPIDAFVDKLRCGGIGALKGLGGYHLVAAATNAMAIDRLRQRKQRDEKPFAVMVRDAAVAAAYCHLSSAERERLVCRQRPIVLLTARSEGLGVRAPRPISDLVAPDNPNLGVMLPYTPLHELLFQAWGDEPLVMTSGNRSDEPIAFEDADAIDRLRGIADLFLVHNRPIRVRCDDSVTRVVGDSERPVRRSRGYAPLPITLPFDCPVPMLAVGGQLKNVFALARGDKAFLSHHIGDLDHLEAYRAFVSDVRLYEQLFDIKPNLIAHDLHPDYQSTIYAEQRHRDEAMRLLPVQHHHAHLASCLAEHGLVGNAIGVVFDGSGYGMDGSVWGGEFLVGGYATADRVAFLRPVRLPGGDRAAREPWRMALSYLHDAGCQSEWWVTEHLARFHPTPGDESLRLTRQMIQRGLNSPWTSSAGRLFDAVAALLGIRQTISFEGQAAMQLEALAWQCSSDRSYSSGTISNASLGSKHAMSGREPPVSESAERWSPGSCPEVIDTRPLIRAVVADIRRGTPAVTVARQFHNTLAIMISDKCAEIARCVELDRVVLSGGVFMNALLSQLVEEKLISKNLRVYQHHRVPANDGGLALGQVAVAAHRLLDS